MKEPYLEVTFRHGRPIAGYYYLPREAGQKSARTRRVEPGLIIDFTAEGQAIGIEITAPAKVSHAALNAVLKELGQAPASEADLAPVLAACSPNALPESATLLWIFVSFFASCSTSAPNPRSAGD